MNREEKTVEVMIKMYCADHHFEDRGLFRQSILLKAGLAALRADSGKQKPGLCADCEELLTYARIRLQKCPFKQNKPSCTACPIHCYSPAIRAKIRSVMRYSGPRMLLKHPLLAIAHLKDSRKNIKRAHR